MLGLLLIAPAPVSAGSRPNIVVIMADDLGPGDGRLLTPEIMPNLNKYIIRKGVRFTHAYGETSLCCPARASFLSGQHTAANGQYDNDGRRFDPSSTVATDLQAAGYRTSFVGKYLNSYSIFDQADLDPPGWTTFDALYEPSERADNVVGGHGGGYTGFQVRKKGGAIVDYEHGGYSTDVIADLAKARIRLATDGQPLFELVTPYAPHRAGRRDGIPFWTPAARDVDSPKCDSIGRWKPASYNKAPAGDPAWTRNLAVSDQTHPAAGYDLTGTCETLLAVDRLIGKVVEALRDEGRLSNTVLVFTADNGMAWGEHRLPSKNNPWATAVPLYIAWPSGRGSSPDTDPTYLSNIDWRATITSLAGTAPGGPNDGLDFSPLIKNQKVRWSRNVIVEDMPAAAVAEAFRGLRSVYGSPIGAGWHYTEYANGDHGLYRAGTGSCWRWEAGDAYDPCELSNLWDNPTYATQQAFFTGAANRKLKGKTRARPGNYTDVNR